MLSDEIVSVRVTLTVCDYSVNFLWIELMMYFITFMLHIGSPSLSLFRMFTLTNVELRFDRFRSNLNLHHNNFIIYSMYIAACDAMRCHVIADSSIQSHTHTTTN